MERLRPSDPDTIGNFSIIARLGSGGMGVVFLGKRDGVEYALKVMRQSFVDDSSLRIRFEREIDTLRKISSPYVARMVDYSVEEEIAWHAVEYIHGPTLLELVDHKGPLVEDDWWELARKLGEALNSVHELGIVHRDIKPANIIMSDRGPKLIDFGIAQDHDATSMTTTGLVAGSPAWLAPEQVEGREVSSATDLFALGSVLIFAGTGNSPWGHGSSTSVAAIYHKILNSEADMTGLDNTQRELVSALHQRDPNSRRLIATRAAERILPERGNEAKTSAPTHIVAPLNTGALSEAVEERERRSKLIIAVGAFLVALIAGGIAAETWPSGSRPVATSQGDPDALFESFDDHRTAGKSFVDYFLEADKINLDRDDEKFEGFPSPNSFSLTEMFVREDGVLLAYNPRFGPGGAISGTLPRHVLLDPENPPGGTFREFGDRFGFDVIDEGRSLLYRNREGNCIVEDVDTGVIRESYPGGRGAPFCKGVVSEDGSLLYLLIEDNIQFFCDAPCPPRPPFVAAYNRVTGESVAEYLLDTGASRLLVTDQYLVTSKALRNSRGISVYSLDTGDRVAEYPQGASVLLRIADSSVVHFMDFAYGEGDFGSLDLETKILTINGRADGRPAKPTIDPQGKLIAWLNGGEIGQQRDRLQIFDFELGVLTEFGYPLTAEHISFSPDGNKLYVGDSEHFSVFMRLG